MQVKVIRRAVDLDALSAAAVFLVLGPDETDENGQVLEGGRVEVVFDPETWMGGEESEDLLRAAEIAAQAIGESRMPGHQPEPQGLSPQEKLDDLSARYLALQEEKRAIQAELDLVRASPDNVWFWQGDGTDNPSTMVKGLPVVMSVETLEKLLLQAARIEPVWKELALDDEIREGDEWSLDGGASWKPETDEDSVGITLREVSVRSDVPGLRYRRRIEAMTTIGRSR